MSRNELVKERKSKTYDHLCLSTNFMHSVLFSFFMFPPRVKKVEKACGAMKW